MDGGRILTGFYGTHSVELKCRTDESGTCCPQIARFIPESPEDPVVSRAPVDVHAPAPGLQSSHVLRGQRDMATNGLFNGSKYRILVSGQAAAYGEVVRGMVGLKLDPVQIDVVHYCLELGQQVFSGRQAESVR